MASSTLKVPKYARLSQEIKMQIDRGIFKPGDRLPSFVELRETYSISPATVERMYASLEQEGIIVRKQGRGTFVAEVETPITTGIIAICGASLSNRSHPYWTKILKGLYSVATEAGKDLLLLTEFSVVNPEKVDGVIIADQFSPTVRKLLGQLPSIVPCVSLLTPTPGIVTVLPDDYQGVFELCQHIISLGHRRIACLYDPGLPHRLLGYRHALLQAGITPLEEWSWPLQSHQQEKRVVDPDFTLLGRNAMCDWISEGWGDLDCTAIIAHNDDTAIGVIEVLRSKGWKVPEQIGVVGYDGTEVGQNFTPALTSVEITLEAIGATAMKLLLQQIDGEDLQTSTIMLPTSLVKGESVLPISRATNAE
jgi:DNA-binding LacI/PurR family transcriptional regulator